MAAAVLWVCSSDASFVTGTTIAVDGGRTAGDFTATPVPAAGGNS
jgi:3-oxoacyl-[acyl-carrier protein] reductase